MATFTQHAASKPPRTHAPPVTIPPEVVEFSDEHGLTAHLDRLVEAAVRIYPNVQAVEGRLQTDPDSGDVRIIVDVVGRATVEEVLAAKKVYTVEKMQTCDWKVAEMIAVLYQFDDA